MKHTADLQKAIDMLKENHLTCVLCKNDVAYTSSERGIKPLINWLKDGISKKDFCAADKVVGRASAFLYVLLGIKEVYATVISHGATDVFENYNISFCYEEKTEYIINRTKTGMCPMESTVLKIKTPQEALSALEEKLKNMQ